MNYLNFIMNRATVLIAIVCANYFMLAKTSWQQHVDYKMDIEHGRF